MTYKYFFFDFDGMLCDSYPHISRALYKTLLSTRKSEISEKEVFDYLKISFAAAFEHFNVTEEEKEIFYSYHHDINFKPEVTLFLPIENLLKNIIASGGKNFIYTNRGETLYDYLQKFNISSYFTDIIIKANKPDPTDLLKMIEKHKLNKDECVVVGDRFLDVEGAYNAKIDGILYDVDSIIFFHHATHVIKRINELYNFIDLPYKLKNNYHTHTARCNHAIGLDEEYVIEAIKAGYQTLGFSDHIMIPDLRKNEAYFEDIALLKEKYKDQIDIKIALEVEYYPYYLPYYQKLLDSNQVDYLIFGNHGYLPIDKKTRDKQICFTDSFTDENILQLYYECLKNAVETKMFKYIAHPDCFLKGYQKWDDKAIALTHKIAKLIQDNHLYAELSGSGYRSRRRMVYNNLSLPTYPFKEFFRILSTYDIKFVIGCDAHAPNQLDDIAVKYLCDMAKELNLNVVYEINDLKGGVNNG